MDRLGRALTSAVTTYNQTVGSLESRVLVSARKLNQLGVVEGDLETPVLIEEAARTLSAPELAAPELAAPELPAPENTVPPQPDPAGPGRAGPERPGLPCVDGPPGAVMAIPGSHGAG
jgi:DNA recombination protein RmuC